MSFETNIKAALLRLSNYAKQSRVWINGNAADLSGLTTTAKGNLMAAINEVNGKTANAGAQINDATPSTTTVYSSSKTNAQILALINDGVPGATTTTYSASKTEAIVASNRAGLKSELLNGVDAAFDSFKEVADYMAGLSSTDTAYATALGFRLRFDAAQTLTAAQKTQGNTNLGSVSLADFGDPLFDYDAYVASALV